jgi:predicted DNA-binding transcriptional regulator AlpA
MEKRIHHSDVLRSGVQIFDPLRHDSSDTEVQTMPTALEAAKPLSPTNGHALPTGVAPRGLSRVQAAEYVGVSRSLFDDLVRDGRMPSPKRVNNRVIWDIRKLDDAFAALPDDGEKSSTTWGDVG